MPCEYLKYHIKSVHTIKKIFFCEIKSCKKEYPSNNSLKLHIASFHDKKREKCNSCDISFTSKFYLKLHIKISHQNIRSFKCDYCAKVFGTNNEKQSHFQRLHANLENENNFCQHCSKNFKTSIRLKCHLKRMHENEKREKPKCHICNKEFELTSHSSLKNHILSVHFGEKYKCTLCGKCFSTNHILKKHENAIHKNNENHE